MYSLWPGRCYEAFCFKIESVERLLRNISKRLNQSMDTISKVLIHPDLQAKVNAIKQTGKKVVFTNGCFDILHVGHVRYLAAARLEGDVLFVGLNSDESVRSIKSPKRPIVKQAQRAEVLASLWCVDYIILFDEPSCNTTFETKSKLKAISLSK